MWWRRLCWITRVGANATGLSRTGASVRVCPRQFASPTTVPHCTRGFQFAKMPSGL